MAASVEGAQGDEAVAEEVEIDGNTIHIYVKRDVNVTGECLIAAQTVPEGATVIIHGDGTETTC